MSTITLPNIRVSSDLTIRLKLKDGGVAIDWSTLQNIRVSLYADDQRSMASRCNVSIDEEDSTILVCQYAANKMQYLGVNRVIVQCKYMGEVKTYDKPAFNFVRWTSDQEGEQITIDDPDVDVEISVEDVSSSILQEAVDAAFDAADRANDAAAAAEHMVDIHTGPEGKSAYEVAVEEGYTGTEEEWLASLEGPVGATPDISIGTVTTVEPGTPAAASMTGTPEAPVLNLSIPKGLVGATPNFTVGTVITGEPGSSVIVTITGTPEAPVLNLTIPQGMQGNTGSSVDYPYELVNNLTTNDATKGLSAAQGVVLDGKVSQLEAELYGGEQPFDIVSGQNTWVILSDYGVAEGDILSVKNNGSATLGFVFTDADNAAVASNYINAGSETDLTIPAGSAKIKMYSGAAGTVSINFHNGDLSVIGKRIDGCVHANESQQFTSLQKATARENIGAASESEVTYVSTEDVNATIGFGNWDYGYIRPTGVIAPLTSGPYRYSDKIPIVPNSPIVVNKLYCNSAFASVAAYDLNDNFIADCSLIQDASIAPSNPLTIQTTGKDVAYIRITVGGGYPDYDVMVTQYSGVKTVKEVILEMQEQIDGISVGTQWNGKSWVALGTSITDTKNTLAPDGTTTGKFVPYLAALSGLVVTDKGVAGSVIGGHILYYAGHTAETANADIITIEGGVNDWAGSRPLGQVGDTVPYLIEWTAPVWNNGGSADGTFAGACYQAIKTAMENSPKAVVVVITDNTGRHIPSTGQHGEREYQNSLGLRQKDYTDMFIAVAKYMGVPVINAGQKSMINQENPEYLIDNIHQTELGGEQFAKTIWSELKMMPLRVTE